MRDVDMVMHWSFWLANAVLWGMLQKSYNDALGHPEIAVTMNFDADDFAAKIRESIGRGPTCRLDR